MMIVSAKVSKKKLLAGLAAAVAVVVLLVTLVSRADAQPPQETTAVTEKAATNEQRLAFLQSFGWEAEETPTETQEVRIPEEFNEVFTRYNELQLAQGYDLSQFKGKTVKRYVYPIRNHPNGEGCFATLLICKNEVIGGDITGPGGMHGFRLEG